MNNQQIKQIEPNTRKVIKIWNSKKELFEYLQPSINSSYIYMSRRIQESINRKEKYLGYLWEAKNKYEDIIEYFNLDKHRLNQPNDEISKMFNITNQEIIKIKLKHFNWNEKVEKYKVVVEELMKNEENFSHLGVTSIMKHFNISYINAVKLYNMATNPTDKDKAKLKSWGLPYE